MAKHYLYRHIRLDKYEPFYIGIGTKNKYDIEYNYYTRAYNKRQRNNIWKGITSKTDYKVEILIESNDYEYIKQKEIYLTKLYGRKDIGTGTLASLTDGGQGRSGYKMSEEVKKIISEKNKGKKHTQEIREKIKKTRAERDYTSKRNKGSKKVYQYNTNGEFVKMWYCAKDIEKELGYNHSAISISCNYDYTAYNYKWFHEDKGNKINSFYIRRGNPKKIYQYSKEGIFIKEWKSETEIINTLKYSSVYNATKFGKLAYGCYWYKEYKGKTINNNEK